MKLKLEFKELLKLRVIENIHSTTARTVIVYPTKNEISYREIHKIYTDENEAYKIYQKCRKYYDIVFNEMIFNEKEFVKNSYTIPNLVNCNTVKVKTLYINRNNREYFKTSENKIIIKPMNPKKKTNSNREPHEFYVTPPIAVEKLLELETFEGNIWECACGDGAISKVLINNKFKVYSSDLIDRGYGNQLDFLKSQSNLIKVDNIITNPPFSLFLDFIFQAKKSSNKKIAMLLPITYLASLKRLSMFRDKEFPLKIVYPFSRRISLYRPDVIKENDGLMDLAWYIWDRSYTGKPQIDWIE